MIDIHCHILPDMDDGPWTLDLSLAMAERAVEAGIIALIATPHTDGVRVNRKRVTAAVHALNKELQAQGFPLTVYPGFEIPYHLADQLAATHTLADNGRHVLIEFPHTHLPHGALNTFFKLLATGLIPVLAHPERNEAVIMRPDILRDLTANGVQVQITAASVTGEFGPDVQQCARYLLLHKQVHFLASDAHSPTFRQPELKKALEHVSRLIGREKARLLVEDNPRKILAGAKPQEQQQLP